MASVNVLTSLPSCLPCLHTVPSVPQNLVAVPSGANSAILEWDPPTMPNGVIIQYSITITDGGLVLNTTTVPGNTTTVEVFGLPPSSTVTFGVAARTSAGQGFATLSTVNLPGTPGPAHSKA